MGMPFSFVYPAAHCYLCPMENIDQKYANLLVQYCLEVQPGERIFIRSSYLAEPLLQEVYKAVLTAGGIPEVAVSIDDLDRILLSHGNDQQLQHVSPLTEKAVNEYEGYLVIRAPFNLKALQEVPKDRLSFRQEAMQPINKTYAARTASGKMKRCLCDYPTQAGAQEAGMSLAEYKAFVFEACHLDKEDPIAAWLEVRKKQQAIVDHLNTTNVLRYTAPDTDITFSTAGRTWINSDGRANMPSGEVFTSPVEDSGEGTVRFTYPAIYIGHEVEDVRLEVKGGEVVKWTAARGQDFLDYFFSLEGARRFGEIAIGSNYGINRFTKNILFDEKIGGTIHMALGQSYAQAGGKNESTVHWDMIADMRQDAAVYADGEKIYENGQFLIG